MKALVSTIAFWKQEFVTAVNHHSERGPRNVNRGRNTQRPLSFLLGIYYRRVIIYNAPFTSSEEPINWLLNMHFALWWAQMFPARIHFISFLLSLSLLSPPPPQILSCYFCSSWVTTCTASVRKSLPSYLWSLVPFMSLYLRVCQHFPEKLPFLWVQNQAGEVFCGLNVGHVRSQFGMESF